MTAVSRHERASSFAYRDVVVDAGTGTITCSYACDGIEFGEIATFDEDVDLGAPGVESAAVLYHLLAGLSYYKAFASRRIELGGLDAGDATVSLLAGAIQGGLGEYAFRNNLDLRDVEISGGVPARRVALPTQERGPLVPFGGGIDSIVTAIELAADPDEALFVVSNGATRFAAIDRSAARTGLKVVRCSRQLDAKILSSKQSGWLDGHVPVTAIVSSLAIIAAIAQRRSSVVMSNERSASSPNLVIDGRPVNHQWSKSLECENLLRRAIDERLENAPSYYSALRDRSELWVASQFATHPEYLDEFMSCNRAFLQDPAKRATTWCGACDKCLFTDLVLSPFVPRAALSSVFSGREPLADPGRQGDLEVLVGLTASQKPFECVGDVGECATALVAAAARPDRSAQHHLGDLAARCSAQPLDELLVASGPTNAIAHAARDLL
ncbi:MAG TPA: hypothetical protein VMQ40_02325 [Acidimicrobiales bacterium]|jgi:hypothetical protein|nr:hypothetical protein [Acidimicrobiales bacterium]